MQKSLKYIIIILFCTLFLSACTLSKRFTGENRVNKKPVSESNIKRENDNLVIEKTQIGIASFYADQFHGKITYSGEVYNMHGLTAAHPSLPMNTVIRVTNLANNKSVVIKINDRMPKHPDRIIDLSYGTAKYLGMEEAGLAKVKVEVLKKGGK